MQAANPGALQLAHPKSLENPWVMCFALREPEVQRRMGNDQSRPGKKTRASKRTSRRFPVGIPREEKNPKSL